ncbi:MAG: nitrophenyl compound nitroreductase subunit ArsF family protein [Muribaculaceae bacterium]
MKRLLLTMIIGLLSLTGMAKGNADDYVEVLYFHGKQRCVTCIAIEKHTKAVIAESFASQQKSGKVRYKEVDIFTPEGKKLAQEYKVSWSSLFVTKHKNGKATKHDLTQFGFKTARKNEAAFKKGLRARIAKALK